MQQQTSDVQEQLRSLIVALTGLPATFDPKADLYLDLGVPSMKAIQLLMDIEDRFGVSVPDERFVKATCLEALTRLVEDLL